MTIVALSALLALIVGTSFVSGLFGMAGGIVLVGGLLMFMPVPAAMVLHAITQMASNGWRAILWWRYVRWATVLAYITGCSIAVAVWSYFRYVPDVATALIFLGLTPFLVKAMPAGLKPNPNSAKQGVIYGIGCMSLMLLTGVAGPLLDSFFLGGDMDRRRIIASKGMCQLFGHGVKLVYFGAIIDQAAQIDVTLATLAVIAAMLGTILAKRMLEAMSDAQFRAWANGLIIAIGSYYLIYGSYLMLTGPTA
ncbi:MAG: sulfite exporter TauE/SafE family protein [Pseudomonadota bacterium]